ncbi:MAG: hypothetical protein ACYC5Q_14280 [Thermoleophilia bacterium]
MDVDGTEADVGSTGGRRREIEELKFLVGTSCSRLINLLMDRETPPAVLGAEAAFIAERAARLAELLETAGTDGGAVGPADVGGPAGD